MVKVSAGTLTKYKNLAESMQTRISKIRAKGEEMVETVQRTAITTGVGFGLGVIQGRTGGTEILGVPLDLLVGVGGHIAGFTKVGGKHSTTLHHIGDAGLVTYAATMGRSVGMNWKTSGKLLGGKTKVAGDLAESGADFASDEDLAAAVMSR